MSLNLEMNEKKTVGKDVAEKEGFRRVAINNCLTTRWLENSLQKYK